MRIVDRVFDDGFDDVAVVSRRLQPGRLLTGLVVAPLVVLLLGRWPGLAWTASLLLCEALTRIGTTPFVRQAPPRRGQRIFYLCTALGLHLVWVGLSLAFWFDPGPTSAFTALLVWTTVLIGGASQAFRSRLAFVAFTGPVSLAMVAAPILAPRFSGAQQMLTVAGLLACVAYAWVLARRNLEAARTLADATADLARQKQAAEAANLAKTAFLAMMSHEIRTPMNGVLGMAHALEDTGLDARQADYVRTLIRSGDGLMSILDDVLDLARIETHNLAVAAEPFDLRSLVLKAQGLWRAAAVDKGLSLSCSISADAPAWVVGDAVRVRQILLSLLSNAIKFTDAGSVRVELDGRPGAVVLSVADTGPGMDEAAQARLFQSFTQAEGVGVRRHGGAGLGLAIAHDLARLMGGRIEVRSVVGQGSEFRLHLPLAAAEPPTASAPMGAAQPESLDVLVVDDNATNRAVAVALLGALGARCRAVEDGAAALSALRERAADLVLMDIHMPGMDGIEAAARIRAGETGDPQVPIMALTADAMEGARERLMQQGFDDYLTKPVNPAMLAQALSRVEPRV
jgi:signal transduction histidine kinase/CheY-like chemotaxis protein